MKPSQELGVGRDGVSFPGERDGKPVVVHHLVHAAGDPALLRDLKQRVRAIELAAGPGVLAVVAHDLDAAVPEIVIERRGELLADRLARDGFERSDALELCTILAAALDRAHRFGLCHGDLRPATIRLTGNIPWLDLLRLDTGDRPPQDARFRSCKPPEADTLTPAADAYSLAQLIALIAGGGELNTGETLILPPPLLAAIDALLATDPDARPAVSGMVLELARLSQRPDSGDADATVDLTRPFSRPDLTDAVGRFVLIEKLGEGAMGVVWRATDRVTNDEVAVKLLSAGVVDQADARFRREARLLAQVRHPNVAGCLDADPDDDVPWIAIELVRGETLGERIDSRWHPRRGRRRANHRAGRARCGGRSRTRDRPPRPEARQHHAARTV